MRGGFPTHYNLSSNPAGFESTENPEQASHSSASSSRATHQQQLVSPAHLTNPPGSARQQALLAQQMTHSAASLDGEMPATHSTPITNPYRSIYERQREGECWDYVPAAISFHRNVSPEVRRAAEIANRGLNNIFPPGLNKIVVKSLTDESGLKGLTRILSNRDGAYIKVYTYPRLDSDTQLGSYTHTMAHELFLHAQSQLEAIYLGVAVREEIDDHRHLYSPADRNNRYLEAMHRVFDQLPSEAAKWAFASAVEDDIRMNADVDEDLSQTEFNHIDLWSSARRNSLVDAIYNRANHQW